jgi:aminoglycoside 6-adenylyltransferase
MKLIEWKIGVKNNFSISIGKGGKFINKYLTDEDYKRVLSTYTDHDIENNWKALFNMVYFFKEIAEELSVKLSFGLNKTEEQNTINYLQQLHFNRE